MESTFSQPTIGLDASGEDRSLVRDVLRLIKCTYREEGDLSGVCNGAYRDKDEVKKVTIRMFAYTATGVTSAYDDENEKSIVEALTKAKSRGAAVSVVHRGRALSDGAKALKKAAKTFKECTNNKGGACLSNYSKATMHSKIVTIGGHTLTRTGVPASYAVWQASSNYGGRSAFQTFNNAITSYNDKAMYDGTRQVYLDMKNKREYSWYYQTGGARGHIVGNDAGGTTTRPSEVMWMPARNLSDDPILRLLRNIEPSSDCDIKVMHNRFKMRRGVVAEELKQLSHGGCQVEVMAYKDDKTPSGQAFHCGIAPRVCAPILGILAGGQDIKVYAGSNHDKAMMIRAKFKDGNGEPETVVQSGSASLTHQNIINYDENITFNWQPQVYRDFRGHWDAAMDNPETCQVSLRSFKLTSSNQGSDADTKKYCTSKTYN